MSAEFDVVDVRIYEDNLRVTEIQPLLDYILSMNFMFHKTSEKYIMELKKFLQTRFQSQGSILIRKSQGVLIAQ